MNFILKHCNELTCSKTSLKRQYEILNVIPEGREIEIEKEKK